jgi:ATP phosphoribosyltransferase regulatory subunit
LGAELYGATSIDADSEIVSLMLSIFDAAKVQRAITLDIGHIGIYDALFSDAAIAPELESEIFDALQRKSMPDIERLLERLPAAVAEKLTKLAPLHGSPEVIEIARAAFSEESTVLAAIDDLEAVLHRTRSVFPDIGVYVDLTELRGFRYHTGLVFAVYLEGRGSAIAKGGRYDSIGAVFGRDRPATGFAIDLKALIDDATLEEKSEAPVIAPVSDDPALLKAVAALRQSGRIVIVDVAPGVSLPGAERLALREGEWVVEVELGS